jgi:hypothetical protein
VPPFQAVGLQRAQDGHIREQQKEKDEHTDKPTIKASLYGKGILPFFHRK